MSPLFYHRVDEDSWFQQNQKLLVSIANTDFGRDLLCIPKDFPKIAHIRKNCIVAQIGDRTFKADFRIGAKYARIIRASWDAFNSYARYFHTESVHASPLTRYALSVSALTLTAYPDPNAETTSVDGFVENYADPGVFATMNAASAGTSINDSATYLTAQNSKPGAADFNLQRAFVLFDTSALTASANISSAVVSIYGTFKADANTDSLRLVASTPASNTALVTGDWDQLGTTALASDITLASFSTTGYNDFTMSDLTAVSKTSITKLGFRTTKDIAATAPTGSNYAQFDSADKALTTSDPKIVATYTVGSAARYLSLLGVGQ